MCHFEQLGEAQRAAEVLHEGELRSHGDTPTRASSSRSAPLQSPSAAATSARRGSVQPGGEPLSLHGVSPRSPGCNPAATPLQSTLSGESAREPLHPSSPGSAHSRRASLSGQSRSSLSPPQQRRGSGPELFDTSSRGGRSGRGGALGDDASEAREARADESDAFDDREMAWGRTRVWGAWDGVHPAALGATSQRHAFPWHAPCRFQGGAGK